MKNKTSNLRATGPCEGNSPVTGKFPSQRASNGENIFHFDDVIMVTKHTDVRTVQNYSELRYTAYAAHK